MPILEYIVRAKGTIWQVWRNAELLGAESTQAEAMYLAEALAYSAAARGERSKILVGELDGLPLEFPTIEPRIRPVADAA
jgi:hypothetical protein